MAEKSSHHCICGRIMTEVGQNRTGSDLAWVQGNGDLKGRVAVRGIQVEVIRVGLTCCKSWGVVKRTQCSSMPGWNMVKPLKNVFLGDNSECSFGHVSLRYLVSCWRFESATWEEDGQHRCRFWSCPFKGDHWLKLRERFNMSSRRGGWFHN